MSFINYAAREINCKIVYYGPGLGGKTTIRITDANDHLLAEKNRELSPPLMTRTATLNQGEKEDGPYCQKCYDADRKLVRLRQNEEDQAEWDCRACGQR